MRRLSVSEFKEECKTLKLRGKYAVLLNRYIITDEDTILKELYSSNTQNYKNTDGY